MTVLVTGAGGFVGQGLVGYLARTRPDEPLHVCDLTAPPSAGSVTGHALDVTDRRAVSALVDKLRPDLVIHAAALTRTAPEDRLAVFDVNMTGSLNVLQSANATGVARIIVASSSGIYADTPAKLRREDDPLDVTNAYAASKSAAEAIAATYGGYAVRIGPVYGPNETARPSRPRISAVGRLHDHLRRQMPIMICGGAITRDWTHVDDIAAGIDALARSPAPRHHVYNLSAGQPFSLLNVAAEFARHGLIVQETDDPTQADIIQRPQDARPPLSLDRLRTDTDFAPHHTLETGIAAVISSSL
ncbi:NAD-dependent epimerase/dehydratase family protein [Primorskyibacter sedentarius]|uniref:NAD-dependent epimerase/dehydratase family protein n=1 Tax=Primorskyibacter sedentarius TaxID=745311 RepID=UPI003EB98257